MLGRVALVLWTIVLLPGVMLGEEGDFLSKLDTNGNGVIEPQEVPERMRKLIDGAAKHAGLDPSGPLPLDKLRGKKSESSSTSTSSGEGGTTTTATQTGSSEATLPPATASSPGNSFSDSASPSKEPALVPGFGEETELPAVPGFAPSDRQADSTRSGVERSSSGGGERSGSDGRTSDSRDPSEKIRRYAESLLRQYDENKNGRLEKDEWRRMRGDPNAADKNRDGIITIEELIDRLASYSRRRSSESSSSSDSRGDRYSRRDKEDDADRPLRFLTPLERLPKGLPDWFLRSDQDGDAQVMMHEFSGSLTDSKVAEFFRYDQNRDGIITPAEALAAEEKAKAGTSSSSSSSSSGSSRRYGRRP